MPARLGPGRPVSAQSNFSKVHQCKVGAQVFVREARLYLAKVAIRKLHVYVTATCKKLNLEGSFK
jgi:hypothetical protein